MKINALKIGAQALASVVLGGALVYYNFIDKTVEVDSNKCPDFTIATYESNGERFVISNEKFTLSNHLGKVIILYLPFFVHNKPLCILSHFPKKCNLFCQIVSFFSRKRLQCSRRYVKILVLRQE